MTTFSYEECLPVARFGWTKHRPDAELAAAETIQASGATGLTILEVEFLEFDSSNPTHACGYWDVTVDGPTDQILIFETSLDYL